MSRTALRLIRGGKSAAQVKKLTAPKPKSKKAKRVITTFYYGDADAPLGAYIRQGHSITEPGAAHRAYFRVMTGQYEKAIIEHKETGETLLTIVPPKDGIKGKGWRQASIFYGGRF